MDFTHTDLAAIDTSALASQVNMTADVATAIVIRDASTYKFAADAFLGFKEMRAKVDAELDPLIKRAHEMHVAMLAKKREHTAPLDAAEKILREKIRVYQLEQERLRVAEENARREEARRKEEERQRIEAAILEEEAAAQRAAVLAMDAAAVAKIATLQSDAAQAGEIDPDMAAEAEIAATEASHVIAAELRAAAGPMLADAQAKVALAAEVRATPIAAPVVVVESSVPKVAGIATKTVWKFRVSNPDIVPREFLAVNEQAIRSVVLALKDRAKIPGVEVYSTQEIAGTVKRGKA